MKIEKILFDKLCNAVSAGVIVVDRDYNIIGVNRDIIFKGNVKEKDVINKSIFEYIHPEDIPKLKDSFDALQNTNEIRIDLIRMTNKVDREFHVEMRIRKMEDMYVITVIDRTQFYKTYKELRMVRSAVDNMVEAMLVTDINGNIVFVNPAFTKITGYTSDEVLGKNPRILKSGKQPKEFYEELWNTILSGKTWHGKLINKKKNGELYWEEMTIAPVKNDNGDIMYFVAIKQDVTLRKKLEDELKAREEFYRTIFNSTFDGIFIETLDGKIIDVNESAVNMLGYTKEELIESDIEKIIPEKERKKIPIIIEELKKRRKFILETENIHKNGHRIPVELAITLTEINGKDHIVVAMRDLTPRKEYELRYRYLAEMANDGVVMINSNGKIIYANPAFRKITGYSPEEILGKKITDLSVIVFSEDKRKRMEEAICDTKRMKKIKNLQFEFDLKRRDGKLRRCEVAISTFEINDKMYGLAIIRDITERKKYEEMLKKDKEKYKILLENLLSAVLIIVDEKIIFVNKSFENIFGYKRDEIIGKHFTEIIYPDMVAITLENYRRRIKGLPCPEHYLVKFKARDNKLLWGDVRATIIEYDGKRADMVNIVDVTPIKEMEDKLLKLTSVFKEIKLANEKEEVYKIAINSIKEILGISSVAILELKEDKLEIVCEYGYNKKGMVIPLNSKNGITPKVVKQNRPYYIPNVGTNRNYIKGAFSVGSEYATPISIDKEIYGVLDVQSKEIDCISEDDRMLLDMLASHMAVALKSLEYQKKLERSNEIQELMLHIVSHDLKNPLAVIKGYVDLLRMDYNEKYLDAVEKAVNEAVDIINKARLFSKLDANKINEVMQSIELSEIINDAANLILEKYKGKKIIVHGNAKINAYPILKEVFINIFDNAFKYGATEVITTIKTKGDIVEIRIADDGPGIPDNKKEQVFNAFRVLSVRGGSGLGLSIVKKVLELHNGDIWIENNIPRGSVFVIKLPTQ